MSSGDIASLAKTAFVNISRSQKTLAAAQQIFDGSQRIKDLQALEQTNKLSPIVPTTNTKFIAKVFDNSRSSDSGKSSSCSPILLDFSFDSGVTGVHMDGNDMQLHKRIQQCQCILLALERDREHFCLIRNRLSKISDRKKKQCTENEYFCNVCCTEFDPKDGKTFVKCCICRKYICRNVKCAVWLAKTAQWECELCQTSKESLAQTSSWVAEQISFHQEKLICPPRARSEIFIPISECNDSSMHFESVSQIGANSSMITAEQKLKIREYVEEIVTKLLGGNLDAIAVNQLSKSENYLPAPEAANNYNRDNFAASGNLSYKNDNSPDLTGISENRLRQMIQKIIAETINLPPLLNTHAVSEIALDRRSKTNNTSLSNGYHRRHRTEHYFEPTIYQDLLATAVLNKIVDKQFNNNNKNKAANGENRATKHDELDQNYNTENLSTTSGSSIEPRSDCSYTDVEHLNKDNNENPSELLLQSAERGDYFVSHMSPLLDATTLATESEEDDYMSVTSSAVGDGTWENNWFFKKKKTSISGSVTASSVGMLVPDPKEDVRAQIGDKAADEVSDLSEIGSDIDDSLDSLRSKLEPINDRLISKLLIGGQNNKEVLDELIEGSSIISNTSPNSQELSFTDVCNEHVTDAPAKNEAINGDISKKTTQMEHKNGLSEEVFLPVGFEDSNSNSLIDQLSHDSNSYNNNRTNITNELIDNDDDERIVLVNKLTNTTTKPINTTTTTTISTETNSNTNTNTITAISSCKQHFDHLNDYSTTSTTNPKRPNNLLTNPVQNNEPPTPDSQNTRRLRRRHSNERNSYNDQIKDEILLYDKENGYDDGKGDFDYGDDENDVQHEDNKMILFHHFVPGSIAEREYKKWYNAVEMPNNPYAPEALKRRISGSQERFIDLPNISPTKEQNTLDILNKANTNINENGTREDDYKRYSRDYYINSTLTSEPTKEKDICAPTSKDIREHTKNTWTFTRNGVNQDLYKASPAEVVETNSSSIETVSQQSIELEGNTATTSDDSDIIKTYNFKKQETTTVLKAERDNATNDKSKKEEKPTLLTFNRSENNATNATATRGSTPNAFKFLQPKRKLLEPSQVLSMDEDEQLTAFIPVDKPVIEAEVAQALPSVKALAKAFLMTTNTTQLEQHSHGKSRDLVHSGREQLTSTCSLDPSMPLQQPKPEQNVITTTDLSSLNTDLSSISKNLRNTKDSATTTSAIAKVTTTTGVISPIPVRKGVLKTNIAFFENLKHN